MKQIKLFTEIFESANTKLLTQTNVIYTYQISRSLLAAATLATLIFTSSNALFTIRMFNTMALNNSLINKISLFYIIGYKNIYISKIISIICLISVISGEFHKITSILHWYISFSFYSALTIIDGGDQITSIITFLLIPISFCDNRKNTWVLKSGEIFTATYFKFLSNSVLFIVQLQIALIYLNSGVAKIFVPDWFNGSAYYYWFSHNAFGAPDYLQNIFGGFFSNSILVATVTWGTIFFEICLFGCLFTSNWFFKNIMFILGIFFHLAIFIIHGLFSFCLVMLACLCLYLKSDGIKLKTTFNILKNES